MVKFFLFKADTIPEHLPEEADLRGREGHPLPGGPNSFNFMQFFGEIWQNRLLAPSPQGNPGSATVKARRLNASNYTIYTIYTIYLIALQISYLATCKCALWILEL